MDNFQINQKIDIILKIVENTEKQLDILHKRIQQLEWQLSAEEDSEDTLSQECLDEDDCLENISDIFKRKKQLE